MLLAIDAGGTKTRLALYKPGATLPGRIYRRSFERVVVERVESRSAASLEEIVSRFLSTHHDCGDVEAACVAVPGPVQDRAAKATNLPWVIREDDLRAVTKIDKVVLKNDLVATIAAVPLLSAEQVAVLHPGNPPIDANTYAVVAPGTGLGESYMYVDPSGRPHPLPSEGGHVEFAPKTELQFDLLRYLSSKLKKRVSFERVLCGPGILNIYSFYRDSAHCQAPQELEEEIAAGSAPAVITKYAATGRYEICVRTLDLFTDILGSHAGDCVLAYLATAGLYLGGGIPPKILSTLQNGRILKSYLDKGRLSPLVEATPLVVIKDDHAALLGAASIAAQL